MTGEPKAGKTRYQLLNQMKAARVAGDSEKAEKAFRKYLQHTGLLGIRPRNGAIVRPLLCVNREDIIHYLESIGQDYVTDSTNLEDEYTRNKIRLNLLPLMQEINPSVKKNLIDTSNYLNDVATIYNKCIEETKNNIVTTEGYQNRQADDSKMENT